MENTYVLEKVALRPSKVKVRQICRVAVNIAFRFLVVAGLIGLMLLPNGMDQGVFGLGGFILRAILMMLLMSAGILGETMTHVDLPLDGGEEDE